MATMSRRFQDITHHANTPPFLSRIFAVIIGLAVGLGIAAYMVR